MHTMTRGEGIRSRVHEALAASGCVEMQLSVPYDGPGLDPPQINTVNGSL